MKYVVLGYALIVLFFSVGVDVDHIPLWIFKIKLGWNLPNILWQITSDGRLLHTIYIFAIYGLVLSACCTAFVVRRHKPTVSMEVIQ